MTEAVFFDTLREGLWISALMSAPLLAVALVAGVGIGLLQALTSVQEMTLTFVPKLAAMFAVFWVTMSMMTDLLVAFFTDGIVPRIFQRNFSTKAEAGRGIGTYSMKLLGEDVLGGEVGFTSSEKDGTVFRLLHPIRE